MDPQLRICMYALRRLAKVPASDFNRVRVGEQRIREYLRSSGASLDRLRDPIKAEGEDDFWITMGAYVQSQMRPPG
jgi:hypothetical protein